MIFHGALRSSHYVFREQSRCAHLSSILSWGMSDNVIEVERFEPHLAKIYVDVYLQRIIPFANLSNDFSQLAYIACVSRHEVTQAMIV